MALDMVIFVLYMFLFGFFARARQKREGGTPLPPIIEKPPQGVFLVETKG
jgi:hypothetical protein